MYIYIYICRCVHVIVWGRVTEWFRREASSVTIVWRPPPAKAPCDPPPGGFSHTTSLAPNDGDRPPMEKYEPVVARDGYGHVLPQKAERHAPLRASEELGKSSGLEC